MHSLFVFFIIDFAFFVLAEPGSGRRRAGHLPRCASEVRLIRRWITSDRTPA